jgi:hypothetical protein
MIFLLLLAAIFSACCVTPASAARLDELTPYLSGEYYNWIEHSDGRRLLKESGPLFSTGVDVGVLFDGGLTLKGRAELFGGEVGYDGETLPPEREPVETDVTYVGSKHELDVGYRITSGALSIEPFGGIGYRWWLRDLQDSTSTTGTRVSGYTEWWQTGYGRFGARGRYRASPSVALFAEGGARYPFYTSNSVDFADLGSVTFRPVGRWSGFAETGAVWQRLKLTLFYEGLRFAASPYKQVGADNYFQPESSSDIFGVRVGWTFR